MSVEAEAGSGEGCLLGSSVLFSLYPLMARREIAGPQACSYRGAH